MHLQFQWCSGTRQPSAVAMGFIGYLSLNIDIYYHNSPANNPEIRQNITTIK